MARRLRSYIGGAITASTGASGDDVIAQAEADNAQGMGLDMIFTQHYLGCLSHALYVIGDETTGRAVVVDPQRDIVLYLDEAEEKDLRIGRVLETHLHADFLSGHLELAAATGAKISFGEKATVEFHYAVTRGFIARRSTIPTLSGETSRRRARKYWPSRLPAGTVAW